MSRRTFPAILCGLLTLLVANAGFAQVAGDAVRAGRALELKVEDRVVTSVAEGDELVVRKVSGKWLWVQAADGARGWVLKEQVRAAREPVVEPATPPARLPASPDGRSTAANPGDDPRLLAIGVLAGQNIYTTYALIGSIADGYAYKAYEPGKVRQLMSDVAEMCQVAVNHLKSVQDTSLLKEDRAAIETVIEIMTLLRSEANALASYAESNDPDDLDAYNEARNTVWPKVQAMLQLE